jgi:hypothetical protein
VRKLKLLSCKKLSIILQKNRDMLTKEKTPLLSAYTQKYLDKDLLKKIELEVLKLAEKFSQKIAP